MNKHKQLQRAIQQMADGSKAGFYTFFLGTSQFVYNSAMLLYGAHEDACAFMADFYQYLYLHLPGYKPSQDLETWISRLLLERFRQLSIGKEPRSRADEAQASPAVMRLSEEEQLSVWRLLEAAMHFPKQPKKRRRGRWIPFAVLMLALLLFFARYGTVFLDRLHAASGASQAITEPTTNEDDAADGRTEATGNSDE